MILRSQLVAGAKLELLNPRKYAINIAVSALSYHQG